MKRFVLVAVLLPMVAFAYTEEEVNQMLEDHGHSVAWLSEKQKIELVVSRIEQNLRTGQYSELSSLLAEDYSEPGMSRAVPQKSVSAVLQARNGRFKLNGRVEKKIIHAENGFTLKLTISGIPNDGGNPGFYQSTSMLVFEKRGRKYWLVYSDGFLAKLETTNQNLLTETGERFDGRSLTTTALSSTPFPSPAHMLIPKNMFQNVDRMTYLTSQSNFNRQIIARPFKTASSIYCDPFYQGFNEVVLTNDLGWHRILAFNSSQDWANTSGAAVLDRPGGLCTVSYMKTYIADRANNMIRYLNNTFASSSDPGVFEEQSGVVINGLNAALTMNFPSDIDVRVSLGLNFVIANSGLNQVLHWNDGGAGTTTVYGTGTAGSGVGEFDYPTSVSFERNFQTGKREKDFYVIDKGNNRLVKVIPVIGQSTNYRYFADFPRLGNLATVDVDEKGYVWVVDASRGWIYKFTPNLDLLGVWGGSGINDGEFHVPTGISSSHGTFIDGGGFAQPLNASADMIVCENLTDNTGARRFTKGVDIMDISAKYEPQTVGFSGPEYIVTKFRLTDEANVTIKFLSGADQSVLFQSTTSVETAGEHEDYYTLPSGMASDGEYLVEITANSIYTGSNTDVATYSFIVKHLPAHVPVQVTNHYLSGNATCWFWDAEYDLIVETGSQAQLTYTWQSIVGSWFFFDNFEQDCSYSLTTVVGKVHLRTFEDVNALSCESNFPATGGGGNFLSVTVSDGFWAPPTNFVLDPDPSSLLLPFCDFACGNIDNDPQGITDITDLTFLIDHLFINFPAITNPQSGNVDGSQDGAVDIADLTMLIDHLFISFQPLQCR